MRHSWRDSKPSSSNSFSLKCLWLLLLVWDKHCTAAVLVFDKVMRYKLGHIQCHQNRGEVSADLGRIFWSLRKSPMVLFTLFNITFKWSSKDKQLSRTTPKCFCESVSNTLLLLKARGELYSIFVFLLNITSWACFLGSGLKLTFH